MPLCSAPANDHGSIYTPLHPAGSTPVETAALQQISSFTHRGCACRNVAPAQHSPPGGMDSTDSSLPPCFIPRVPNDEPLLHATSIENALAGAACFLNLGSFVDSSCDDDNDCSWGEGQVANLVGRCLQVDRRASMPQRAVYLIGDSHAASIAPGIMAALDGAVDMVWAAAGWGCGILDDRAIASTFSTDEERRERFMHDICRAWNQAVVQNLEQTLRPCDVVVVHQERGKMNAFMVDKYTSLQAQVTRLGATMVFIGDSPKLPERAAYCVPSAFSSNAAARCEQAIDAVNHPTVGQQHNGWVTRTYEEQALSSLAQADGTLFMSIYELMCDSTSQTCGAFIPGTQTLAYFDKQHLTSAGAFYLWPFICSFFRSNGLLGA